MQLSNKGASEEILVRLRVDFDHQIKICEGASDTSRFIAIHETFFALNPFPECSKNSCSFHHPYQEVSHPSLSVCFSY